MQPNSDFRKVMVSPVELLKESFSLMGDQYWLFVGITFVGLLIGQVVPIILMGPMMCGIYLCFLLRMKGQEVTFETLFKGFDYFVESLIATLIVMAISFLAFLPVIGLGIALAFGAATGGGNGLAMAGPLMIMGYLGVMVLSLLIYVCFVFVYPLIVDRQMQALPAVKMSAQAALANFGGIFLLFLLNGAISMAAACACYIPVFFFMPIAIGATALLYRDVFPK